LGLTDAMRVQVRQLIAHARPGGDASPEQIQGAIDSILQGAADRQREEEARGHQRAGELLLADAGTTPDEIAAWRASAPPGALPSGPAADLEALERAGLEPERAVEVVSAAGQAGIKETPELRRAKALEAQRQKLLARYDRYWDRWQRYAETARGWEAAIARLETGNKADTGDYATAVQAKDATWAEAEAARLIAEDCQKKIKPLDAEIDRLQGTVGSTPVPAAPTGSAAPVAPTPSPEARVQEEFDRIEALLAGGMSWNELRPQIKPAWVQSLLPVQGERLKAIKDRYRK
jgi:hypothetical protein